MSGSVNCSQSTSSKGQQQQETRRKSTNVESAKTTSESTSATATSSVCKNGADGLNDSIFDSGSPPCAKSSESSVCRFHLSSWKKCFTKKGSSSCNCESMPQNERQSHHHRIAGEGYDNVDVGNAAQGAVPSSTCNRDACSAANCPSAPPSPPSMVNSDGYSGTGNRKTSFKITSVREKTGSESEDDDSANSDGEHRVAQWPVNGVPPSPKVTPTGGRPSRFHIVTVSGRPYKRDRWLCQDIEPIPEEGNGNGSGRSLASMTATPAAAASVQTPADRGQLSTGANTPRRKFAITKVPEAVIQSTFSASAANSSNSTAMSKPLPNKASASKTHGDQSGPTDSEIVGSAKASVSSEESPSVPQKAIRADSEKGSPSQPGGPLPLRSVSVQSSPSIVHASATDEGPSNGGGPLNGEKAQSIEIDGKIDKAMDLVKVHLLYAVRTEVKQLKEEIDRLNKELSCLKIENSILRRHVPLEVIAVLSRKVRAETEKLSSEN